MKRFVYFLAIVSSLSVWANLKVLNDQEAVKASDLNHNFSYLKSLLLQKNVDVNFTSFIPGEVISKESLEAEFDKIKTLGIPLTPVEFSDLIKSEELNQRFNSAKSGYDSFNDRPLAKAMSEIINEDTPLIKAFDFINAVGSPVVSIVNNPSSGSVQISGTNFTYTPNLNFNGSDSFSYRVFDGEFYSDPASVSISITAIMISLF